MSTTNALTTSERSEFREMCMAGQHCAGLLALAERFAIERAAAAESALRANLVMILDNDVRLIPQEFITEGDDVARQATERALLAYAGALRDVVLGGAR